MEEKPTREELKKRHEEAVNQMIAAFPYERVEVVGEQALATWEGVSAEAVPAMRGRIIEAVIFMGPFADKTLFQ